MNSFHTSLATLPSAAAEIINAAKDCKIFLFYGEMGAGKTTLIKAICESLGVKEAATSPTFSIVNEYRGKNGRIFHFDFYRLKNETEALDMGYEEYFYSGDYCFIEWPEKISGLLPEHYVKIDISNTGDESRTVTLMMI